MLSILDSLASIFEVLQTALAYKKSSIWTAISIANKTNLIATKEINADLHIFHSSEDIPADGVLRRPENVPNTLPIIPWPYLRRK